MCAATPALKSAAMLFAVLALAPGLLADAVGQGGLEVEPNASGIAITGTAAAPMTVNGLIGVRTAPLRLDELPASAFGDH